MYFITAARPPQILKNYRRKEMSGLAPMLFLATMAANLTYGAGVLLRNHSSAFILSSLPWLLGSLGTVAFDCFIMGQFWHYGRKNKGGGGAYTELP
jgi:hypothetical protein